MTGFERPRGATIVFSDVYGRIPTTEQGPSALTDFDAILTDDARNKGRFFDGEFPIGAWPEIGDYGVVLIEQLREEQTARAINAGIDIDSLPIDPADSKLHPDLLTLADSLSKAVVVVVNSAPRTTDHHANGANGEEFYAGTSVSGVEVYSQLPYFRGLHARGQLSTLARIPNDSGLWKPGEQYRSSAVTQVRVQSDILEAVSLKTVPPIELDGRVAYADTFGNVRLEVKDAAAASELLANNEHVRLRLDNKAGELVARVVASLVEIPEGQLAVYHNPADKPAQTGPAYIELAKRVSDPVNNRSHAYAALAGLASGIVRPKPQDWENINIIMDA